TSGAQVAIRRIGRAINIIPCLDHRVLGRRARLPGIDLGAICKKAHTCRMKNLAGLDRRRVVGAGEKAIVAVAVRRACGLKLELREQVVERRTKFDATSFEIWKKNALADVESAFALSAWPQPAEPVKLTIVCETA